MVQDETEPLQEEIRGIEVYLVYVEATRCDACGECVRYCPTDVYRLHLTASADRPQNCLGCGTCMAVCHTDAIVITEI
jgi:ferredoxin